jgi:3-dehydroquinate synthase
LIKKKVIKFYFWVNTKNKKLKIIETALEDGKVITLMNANFENINAHHQKEKIVILTDETVFALHKNKFEGYIVITIDGTEKNKTQQTIDGIINQLLEKDIDKSCMLVGVGGGVVTDMSGYVASIYKRGIKLGLVPTTILGMTDAAIGGKNGVNVGMYKNMVGTTYRPQFILYDFSFLQSLPKTEWINGFAEIIKHACIKDAAMFERLEKNNIDYFIQNKEAIALLIEENAELKMAVVKNDEHETGERYMLNFGHTFGHAVENLYKIPHGNAVSIGMVIAAKISEEINNFESVAKERLIKLLQQYELPISMKIDKAQVLSLLKKDKKRAGDEINFVLLNSVGEAIVQKISFIQIEHLLDQTL